VDPRFSQWILHIGSYGVNLFRLWRQVILARIRYLTILVLMPEFIVGVLDFCRDRACDCGDRGFAWSRRSVRESVAVVERVGVRCSEVDEA
jgi:hypothetical protein